MTQKIKNPFQPLLAPSLLSADFSCLADEVQSVQIAGADWLHVDVMDGHFVPNLTLGPLIVEAIRSKTKLPLDCHLMVSEPQNWIGPFAKAGADWITVHAEATPHLDRVLQQIKDLGCKAGVSLNPGSPLALIEEVLHRVDMVLIMSVNPGFGGQKFIPSTIQKIERLKRLRSDHSFLIEVDGGVSTHNIGELRRAGADVFVAGSAIFGESDRQGVIRKMKAILNGVEK